MVGGGIVGCALACRLANDVALRRGSSSSPGLVPKPTVGLVEAKPPVPIKQALERQTPDARVYSLTPASVRLLDSVGAWGRPDVHAEGANGGACVKERSQSFRSMQVSATLTSRQSNCWSVVGLMCNAMFLNFATAQCCQYLSHRKFVETSVPKGSLPAAWPVIALFTAGRAEYVVCLLKCTHGQMW